MKMFKTLIGLILAVTFWVGIVANVEASGGRRPKAAPVYFGNAYPEYTLGAPNIYAGYDADTVFLAPQRGRGPFHYRYWNETYNENPTYGKQWEKNWTPFGENGYYGGEYWTNRYTRAGYPGYGGSYGSQYPNGGLVGRERLGTGLGTLIGTSPLAGIGRGGMSGVMTSDSPDSSQPMESGFISGGVGATFSEPCESGDCPPPLSTSTSTSTLPVAEPGYEVSTPTGAYEGHYIANFDSFCNEECAAPHFPILSRIKAALGLHCGFSGYSSCLAPAWTPCWGAPVVGCPIFNGGCFDPCFDPCAIEMAGPVAYPGYTGYPVGSYSIGGGYLGYTTEAPCCIGDDFAFEEGAVLGESYRSDSHGVTISDTAAEPAPATVSTDSAQPAPVVGGTSDAMVRPLQTRGTTTSANEVPSLNTNPSLTPGGGNTIPFDSSTFGVPATNPAPAPAPTSQPSLPVVPTELKTTGLIRMTVPEDARVIINGYQTRMTGTERTFAARDLVPGETYPFEIVIQVERNGEILSDVQSTILPAGTTQTLAFNLQRALLASESRVAMNP